MALIAKKSEQAKPSQRRISAVSAGYMELEGAKKDADCQIVEVKNGISGDLGCCNLYGITKGSQKFSCGTCEYVTNHK